jgi:hypothetical protein
MKVTNLSQGSMLNKQTARVLTQSPAQRPLHSTVSSWQPAQQPLLSSPLRSSPQPQSAVRGHVCGCAAVAEASAAPAPVQAKPSSAETARTIVSIMSHGTLSTLSEDGAPLGTYASYVLDERGLPILRLRAEAVHTCNLLRNPRCSLFVQPEDMPARLLARATLIGRVRLLHSQPPLCAPVPTYLSAARC